MNAFMRTRKNMSEIILCTFESHKLKSHRVPKDKTEVNVDTQNRLHMGNACWHLALYNDKILMKEISHEISKSGAQANDRGTKPTSNSGSFFFAAKPEHNLATVIYLRPWPMRGGQTNTLRPYHSRPPIPVNFAHIWIRTVFSFIEHN